VKYDDLARIIGIKYDNQVYIDGDCIDVDDCHETWRGWEIPEL
jgi:hypothetical protein